MQADELEVFMRPVRPGFLFEGENPELFSVLLQTCVPLVCERWVLAYNRYVVDADHDVPDDVFFGVHDFEGRRNAILRDAESEVGVGIVASMRYHGEGRDLSKGRAPGRSHWENCRD